MKKPNYGFEKHQKEMKRKKKQEEKMRRKLESANETPNATQVSDSGELPK